LLAEARQALLLSRLGGSARPEIDDEPDLLTARQALELATRGGAAVLGRDELGSLEPGKCADFIAIRLGQLGYAGALHDPVAAAVFCAPAGVDVSVVHGRKVVVDGRLIGIVLPVLVERHNRARRDARRPGVVGGQWSVVSDRHVRAGAFPPTTDHRPLTTRWRYP
jgi:cytosine/adenosine deaminase-related metal-dependent hydrolase